MSNCYKCKNETDEVFVHAIPRPPNHGDYCPKCHREKMAEYEARQKPSVLTDEHFMTLSMAVRELRIYGSFAYANELDHVIDKLRGSA